MSLSEKLDVGMMQKIIPFAQSKVTKTPYVIFIIVLLLLIGCTNSSESDDNTAIYKDIAKAETPAKTQAPALPETLAERVDEKGETDVAEEIITQPETPSPIETENRPNKITQEPLEADYQNKPEKPDESSLPSIPGDVEEDATVKGMDPVNIIDSSYNNSATLTEIEVETDTEDKPQESLPAISEEILPEDMSDGTGTLQVENDTNTPPVVVSPNSSNGNTLLPRKPAHITGPALLISQKDPSGKDYTDMETSTVEATAFTESPESKSINNNPIEARPSAAEVASPVITQETATMEQSSPEETYTITLLPLENLSEEGDALKHIIPVLAFHLEKKGLTVLYGEEVDTFICNERVRTTGQVTDELALKLKNRFNVKAILTGSIISFSADKNPTFGILLRLIDSSSSSILWADYASAAGDDFSTILGLGKIKSIHSLIPRVIPKILSSLSIEKLKRNTKSARKVAVLPFQNNSDFPNAGKIAMYMFINELLKNQNFEPIEYGNTRKQIVRSRIRNRGELDYENLRALSNSLETDAVILGIVDSYSHKTKKSTSPEVAITARLLESGKSKIVWYNSHLLSGDDDVIALDWGKIKSVHKVAYSIIVKMVEEIGMAKWPE